MKIGPKKGDLFSFCLLYDFNHLSVHHQPHVKVAKVTQFRLLMLLNLTGKHQIRIKLKKDKSIHRTFKGVKLHIKIEDSTHTAKETSFCINNKVVVFLPSKKAKPAPHGKTTNMHFTQKKIKASIGSQGTKIAH